MTFSTDQITALSADLARAAVKSREQSGRKFSYIEGWHAEAEANRIFGYHAWDSETLDLRVVAEKPRKIGQSGNEGWSVSYIAKVRVTVTTPEGHKVVRDGIGAGHGIDRDLGLAHESAAKEAETDAEKRALKTFGNPFGLALYDKTQAHVSDQPPPPGPLEALPVSGRLSSAEAKRRKEDEKIKAEIRGLDKSALGNWMARFNENTAHLPFAWLDSIRDFAEGHLADLDAPPEAHEMDEAFRGAVGPGERRPGRVASGGSQVAVA